MITVVKIGTSSVTSPDGTVALHAVAKLADEVAAARRAGEDIVIVTSGAVTAGVATLWPGGDRPSDLITLQAIAAVGQHRLMAVYDAALGAHGLTAGQVLLVPADFGDRRSYLRARATLLRLLEIGVIPIVNENDPLSDDELRFGDNDRLAALLANLLDADLLVILTDTAGLFDADPKQSEDASLVEEVTAIDAELEAAAGGSGSPGGRGGMASKLAAAHIASWSGRRVVIAAASRPDVLADALAHKAGVGTVVMPAPRRLSSRKLWIAFALPSAGEVVVDAGACAALVRNEASLLPAGVLSISGSFAVDDAIEIRSESGAVIAKGIARLPSERAGEWVGRRTADLPGGLAREVVNRDDLVVLVEAAAR